MLEPQVELEEVSLEGKLNNNPRHHCLAQPMLDKAVKDRDLEEVNNKLHYLVIPQVGLLSLQHKAHLYLEELKLLSQLVR